jgi:hypothetical protein
MATVHDDARSDRLTSVRHSPISCQDGTGRTGATLARQGLGAAKTTLNPLVTQRGRRSMAARRYPRPLGSLGRDSTACHYCRDSAGGLTSGLPGLLERGTRQLAASRRCGGGHGTRSDEYSGRVIDGLPQQYGNRSRSAATRLGSACPARERRLNRLAASAVGRTGLQPASRFVAYSTPVGADGSFRMG